MISFSCFGLLSLPLLGNDFWPFTDVQNGNQREVTGKCGNPKNHGLRGYHGWMLGWRLTQTPYNMTRDSSRSTNPCYQCNPWSALLRREGVDDFNIAPRGNPKVPLQSLRNITKIKTLLV